jgi:hypothetical protein
MSRIPAGQRFATDYFYAWPHVLGGHIAALKLGIDMNSNRIIALERFAELKDGLAGRFP